MNSPRAQQTSPKNLRPRFLFDLADETRDDEAVLRARLAHKTAEQKRIAIDVELKLQAYAKTAVADRSDAHKQEILAAMAKRFALLDDIEVLEYDLKACNSDNHAPRLNLSAISCEARAKNFFDGWLQEMEMSMDEEFSSSQ